MPTLEKKESLFDSIKDSVEQFIPAANQEAMQDFKITDSIRQSVLAVLIPYSDDIPHPGAVNVNGTIEHPTLLRWQILAYISGIDLTLAKWFESHLDALNILNEVGYDKPIDGLWAVWAAEGHPTPVRYQQVQTAEQAGGRQASDKEDGQISGTKTWCSGANIIDYALMTYRDDKGQSQLLIVDMAQAGIQIDSSAWQAVGMHSTDTATLHFNQVIATNVGAPNEYLSRVGFWHGAAGVATCWYGATASIAHYLVESYTQKPNDYKAMYLGEVSTAMAVSEQYIHHVASLIDSQPTLSHELAIRQLRANVEQLSRLVIDKVGLALGATPFCLNAHFARLNADLAVFIRQSHGAFDLKIIGELSGDISNALVNDITHNVATDNSTTDKAINLWRL